MFFVFLLRGFRLNLRGEERGDCGGFEVRAWMSCLFLFLFEVAGGGEVSFLMG